MVIHNHKRTNLTTVNFFITGITQFWNLLHDWVISMPSILLIFKHETHYLLNINMGCNWHRVFVQSFFNSPDNLLKSVWYIYCKYTILVLQRYEQVSNISWQPSDTIYWYSAFLNDIYGNRTFGVQGQQGYCKEASTSKQKPYTWTISLLEFKVLYFFYSVF